MNILAISADLYTPLLLLCWGYYWQKASRQTRRSQIKRLLLCVVIVYSVMLLDNYLHIWPSLEMDYSTHSAVALLFVVSLSLQNKHLLLIAPLSLCVYFYLMWRLNYHSVADMLITSFVLLPAFIYINKKGK
ncbi:MAG: hypothetical protein ACJAT7_000863 [Psychromonas sp.]|jgi:hypothetical protein|uniref:hypothetical protein n=1 Tax=Psychromonas sp. TaxID=1884585 RepID=UPI0039E68C5C